MCARTTEVTVSVFKNTRLVALIEAQSVGGDGRSAHSVHPMPELFRMTSSGSPLASHQTVACVAQVMEALVRQPAALGKRLKRCVTFVGSSGVPM